MIIRNYKQNNTNHMKNIIQKTKSYSTYIMILYIVLLFTGNINAQVSGTVYRDLPVEGTTANTYGVKDSNELGVEGVTVTVYPGGLSATTAADGTYTVAGVNGAVRVEFSNWPTYLKESPDGGGANTSVQFVTAAASDVDFGLHNPADFSQIEPPVLTSHFICGSITAAGTQDAIVSIPYDASGNNPAITIEGEKSTVGSVWGLAYDKTNKKLFSSAFLKRHSGLGSGGLGAIYSTDVTSSANATLFVTIPNVGSINEAARDLGDQNVQSQDEEAFGKVGKVGLGDIDISDDDKFLYVTNLNNKKLYVVDIVNQSIIGGYDVPNPNCSNGDYHPFAVTYHDGLVYVGVVCDGATGTRTDLRAYVYSFSPNTMSFNPNSVLDFPLDYIHSGSTHSGSTVGQGGESQVEHSSKWHVWTDTYDPVVYNANIVGNTHHIAHPVPMFVDIEFQADGTMLLGLADRSGHQLGTKNILPNLNKNENSYAGGDILKAISNGSGGWIIEEHVTVGDNSVEEFYTGDFYKTNHTETSNGGLGYLLGSNLVFLTAMDPTRVNGGGIIELSSVDGAKSNTVEIFNGTSPDGEFGKAHGMGDIEFLSDPAPIEIGNLVWEDTDGDGVQDPDESGIEGVVIKLFQGANELASATTDASGHYIFSNDPNGTTTASHIYNISQLVEGGIDYMLVIEDVDGANKQTPLTGYLPTDAKTGEGSNNKSNDSNGVLNGTRSEETVASHDIAGVGNNNHSYDFGFEPLPNCDNTPNMICDDATTSYTLTAEAGLTNVVWYNSSDVQVGTGNTLVVDSNTPGMDDGNDSYYYEATDGNGCPIELCCPVYFETEVCCLMDETHSTECNDNGTPADETDDYFNLTVTGNLTGGSGNYIVKIGTYTSASTASGTAITVIGDGTDTNLASGGASTYTVKVEDSVNSSCFAEFTVGPIDECSECPAPDCLMIQVKKKN